MFQNTSAFSSFSTNDLTKAKEFYGGTLGLEVSDTEQGVEIALPGGGRLFIYPKDNHEPATFTVLNFVVPDIDAAVEKLAEKGITLERYDEVIGIKSDDKGIMRGKEAGMGPDICWFKDPAGNIIGVLEE